MNKDELLRAKEKVQINIKDMTLEELQIAMEGQNMGMFKDLQGIVLSHLDVIRQQQEQINKNTELMGRLVDLLKETEARVEMLMEKHKALEEFALIGSGIKKVEETNIGKGKILQNVEERFMEDSNDKEMKDR